MLSASFFLDQQTVCFLAPSAVTCADVYQRLMWFMLALAVLGSLIAESDKFTWTWILCIRHSCLTSESFALFT